MKVTSDYMRPTWPQTGTIIQRLLCACLTKVSDRSEISLRLHGKNCRTGLTHSCRFSSRNKSNRSEVIFRTGFRNKCRKKAENLKFTAVPEKWPIFRSLEKQKHVKDIVWVKWAFPLSPFYYFFNFLISNIFMGIWKKKSFDCLTPVSVSPSFLYKVTAMQKAWPWIRLVTCLHDRVYYTIEARALIGRPARHCKYI